MSKPPTDGGPGTVHLEVGGDLLDALDDQSTALEYESRNAYLRDVLADAARGDAEERSSSGDDRPSSDEGISAGDRPRTGWGAPFFEEDY